MNEISQHNNTEQKSPEQIKKIQFWNRIQLVFVLIVFSAPIAGAFFYKPKGFTNYGDIYTPIRPMENLLLQGKDGEVEFDSMRRQWVLLVKANENCSDKCEANILKVRQLRFMQNNDMLRIRTVFLHTQLKLEIANDLAAKYSPIESYSVAKDDFIDWTNNLRIDQESDLESDSKLNLDQHLPGNSSLNFQQGQ